MDEAAGGAEEELDTGVGLELELVGAVLWGGLGEVLPAEDGDASAIERFLRVFSVLWFCLEEMSGRIVE